MTIVIKKETISRLLKDIKEIMKNPLVDNGIHYFHDDTDILKGYALIIGSKDTPYFGGYYFFEINYPYDYPYNPPKVKYCTNKNKIRFNPNLYADGKVCISLLNTWHGEQWTSCQTISTILLTLCTLLCKNPLLNEPGVNDKHNDLTPYNEIILFSNISIAVCDIVTKEEDIFLPFFNYFYSSIIESFKKNYDDLLLIATHKNKEFNNEHSFLKTSFYNLKVIVDYNIIIKKLQNAKKNIDN